MSHQESPYQFLGKGRRLVEGLEKVTGRIAYAADLTLPRMLHARPVLSLYPHAKILTIDSSAAKAMSGVVAVLTAQDLRTRDQVITSRNSAILALDKVVFSGQPVAIVVAESEAIAQDAADQVFVEYEPLPAVIDLETAAQPDAPLVWPQGVPGDKTGMTCLLNGIHHKDNKQPEKVSNIHNKTHVKRGDVELGFAEADLIVEHTYKTPFIYQGYLEPQAAIADPEPISGRVTIYTSTQAQFVVRDEVANILSLPRHKVRIVPMAIGGGFGAKRGILEPLIAAVALTIQQPVRLVLTRSEDFLTTTPFPAMVIKLKTGVKQDGTLTALQARVLVDSGVFAFTLGKLVGILLGSYYKFPHLQIDCYEVITHKPQAGSYRAPGAVTVTFAIESQMDEMATALGLEPLEFRYQNAVDAEDKMNHGEPWGKIGLKKCLARLRDHPAWKNRVRKPGLNQGVGLAVGAWWVVRTPSASICRVDTDGTVRIHVGSVDISGVNSSFALVAAEVLAVHPDQVEVIQGDTATAPFAGPSGASRVTYNVAAAVANAAAAVKKKLLNLAADHLEACEEDLELKNGQVQVKGVPTRAISIGELAQIAVQKVGGPGPIIGEGTSAIEENAPSFAVHLVEVEVDPETGQVRPTQYVVVQDVGFALNPLMVEGQIHGGVVQGIGWGLHERMIHDNMGQLLTGSLIDYDLPKADRVPAIETILVQNPSEAGPFGARGVAELPITAVAAAIANAIKETTGIRMTELPIRPEVLWQAMQKKREHSA